MDGGGDRQDFTLMACRIGVVQPIFRVFIYIVGGEICLALGGEAPAEARKTPFQI
jgi:hypothetical protein